MTSSHLITVTPGNEYFPPPLAILKPSIPSGY